MMSKIILIIIPDGTWDLESSYPINKDTDTDTLFNIMLTCLWLVN